MIASIAANWQIGYAPDSWDAFLKWALDRGYRRGQIVQSGLVKLRDESRTDGEVYDRFRNRIMFPICNDVGEVIAFSGRILEKDVETAKYLNSPDTPLFRKGNVLFGLHKTKRALIEANCAIVCEGQLDLITLVRSRHRERRGAARHCFYRAAGAHSEALRQRSGALLRC